MAEIERPWNEKVILVDSNSLLYRSYYALPNLSTKDGFPTGGSMVFCALCQNYSLKLTAIYHCGDAKGSWLAAWFLKNTRPIDRRLLMSFHCKEKSYLTYWRTLFTIHCV